MDSKIPNTKNATRAPKAPCYCPNCGVRFIWSVQDGAELHLLFLKGDRFVVSHESASRAERKS